MRCILQNDYHPFCYPSSRTRMILVTPSLKIVLNLSLMTESICNLCNWNHCGHSVHSVWKAGDLSGLPTWVHQILGFFFWSRFQGQEWKLTTWAGATPHPTFLGRGNKYSNVYSGLRAWLSQSPPFSSQNRTGKILPENGPCGWTSNIVEFTSLAGQQK